METTDIRKDRGFGRLSDRQICILLYLFCFLMMTVMGSVLSISYILDETGTMANAAFLAGYNWGDWVSNTGGYFYKYGQAPFYAWIFKLIDNPYLIYKMIMVVNGAFVAWIPTLSYRVCRKHLGEQDKAKCAMLSLVLTFVPATILYSLFARADVMLIAFAWITLYVLLQAADQTERKKQILYSGLVGFVSVYMYMCHARGIVFVIAIGMVVVVWRFFVKEKRIWFSVYAVNVVIWLFVDKKLTRYFKSSIWGSGAKKNTVENMNYDKYRNLLTVDGIRTVVHNITGWLFGTFLGTLGLAVLGLVFAFMIVIFFIAKKQQITPKEAMISLYVFLSYAGTVAVGVLFSFGSNYKFVTGQDISRADRFLYSRYIAPTYSILIFVGLYYLFFRTDRFRWKTKLVTLLLGGGLIVYCRTWLGGYVNGVEYSWRNTIDAALFFDTVRYGNDANRFEGVSRALILAAIFAFVILLVCFLLNWFKIKYTKVTLAVLACCFLVSLTVNYKKLRFSTDVRPMVTVGPVITGMYQLEEDTDISKEYGEVYVDPSITRKRMFQMAMPHFTVHVNRSMQAEEVENMFIVAKRYTLNDGWYGEDCYLLPDYDMEDGATVILVKGEQLRTTLEQKGVNVQPVPADYAEQTPPKRVLWFSKDMKLVFDYQKAAFTYGR